MTRLRKRACVCDTGSSDNFMDLFRCIPKQL